MKAEATECHRQGSGPGAALVLFGRVTQSNPLPLSWSVPALKVGGMDSPGLRAPPRWLAPRLLLVCIPLASPCADLKTRAKGG